KQESTLEQLAKGNERHAQEDGHVGGAAIPEARDLPQKTGSGEGFGVSEKKGERVPNEGTPTRLAVRLQQEAIESMRSTGVSRAADRGRQRQNAAGCHRPRHIAHDERAYGRRQYALETCRGKSPYPFGRKSGR